MTFQEYAKSFKISEEENSALKNYIDITCQDLNIREKLNKKRELYWIIVKKCYKYGEDGYGDKPKEMDRFSYWLQHLKLES